MSKVKKALKKLSAKFDGLDDKNLERKMAAYISKRIQNYIFYLCNRHGLNTDKEGELIELLVTQRNEWIKYLENKEV